MVSLWIVSQTGEEMKKYFNLILSENKDALIRSFEGEFSIYMLSSSWEDRSVGSARILFPEYRPNLVILLEYNKDRVNSIASHNKIFDAIPNDANMKNIDVTEERIIPVIEEVVELIESNVPGDRPINIVFDISTIPKMHILLLLKAIERMKTSNRIILLYTEPEEYNKDLSDPQSDGINQIVNPPTFYGDYDYAHDSVLAIILGYEGDRATALYERIDPSECLLFIPDPPYREEWAGRTEKFNESIINLVGSQNIEKIDSMVPINVYSQLQNRFSSLAYIEKNVMFAPLGTKPQTVGLYLYLKKYPINKIIFYASPRVKNELQISTGIGKAWILRTEEGLPTFLEHK